MSASAQARAGRPTAPTSVKPVCIAFRPFGGQRWLGGIHYLTTLLSALHEHARNEVEAVLFAPPTIEAETIDRLRPYLRRPPVPIGATDGRAQSLLTAVSDGARRRSTRFDSACSRHGVDLAFQHADWLGSRFSTPTLAWLGDFQHRVLPEMFPPSLRWKRELRFRTVLGSASLLYVLSEADKALGRQFYPQFSSKLRALPFAVALPEAAGAGDPAAIRGRYSLPRRFVLFPGQLWKHKNHLTVIEAVARLKAKGSDVTVVSCGSPVDLRDPHHGARVRQRLVDLGIAEQFRILGMIPRPDTWALMRASIAVINPSLYEGWSTPVEEAKALGKPILLSDLAVHREQQPGLAAFFDPRDPDAVATALGQAWRELGPGPCPDQERQASTALVPRRRAFAQDFVSLAREALQA